MQSWSRHHNFPDCPSVVDGEQVMKRVMKMRVLPWDQPLCSPLKLWLSKVFHLFSMVLFPVQLSTHPPRPNSTVGPGPALYGARGERGAGVFLNMFLIKPCQTMWRKGGRWGRSGTDGSDWQGVRKQLSTQTRAAVLLKLWGSLSLDHKAS